MICLLGFIYDASGLLVFDLVLIATPSKPRQQPVSMHRLAPGLHFKIYGNIENLSNSKLLGLSYFGGVF